MIPDKELNLVTEAIDKLIAADAYPDSVRPEYLRDAMRDYPMRGGKRLRPALLIWSCRMLGGTMEQALLPAAAAEVAHNWTLVHDDIIDQDPTRRGRPTCHVALAGEIEKRFELSAEERARSGRDFAILAGDLQQGWANDLLARSAQHGVSPEVVIALMRRFQKLTNCDLVTGEALDVELALRELADITPAEVRRMFEGKTGALLRFCTEGGAMIALGSCDPERPEVKRLGEFAVLAGIAYQLHDDYLGIFGDEQKLGKPIGNDLREGKATILLLETLRKAPAANRNLLYRMLGRRIYTAADLEVVREIMEESGAAETVRKEARETAERAKAILAEYPDNRYRTCLEELADYLVARDK